MSRVTAITAPMVVATVCMVAACTGTPSATKPPDAVYASTPCPQPNIAGVPDLDFPASVQCGYLTVPENRAKPDGRKIRIFVMRAPAVSATPKPDPLVYLSGGPGGAGSFEVTSMIKEGLNADREVIFVDQRGTHHADPLLACPEADDFVNDAISVPFTAESTTAGDAAALQKCRDRLAATGVDLASYNTAENAADIADLRVALGIDTWNVYGVSYGSNLALSVLRDHPQGIRSVVLDSVSPPSNNIVENWWTAPASSFKAIFAACAAQPSCARAYPNLAADFTATVNRLDKTPVVVQTTDAAGAPVTVNIDGFPFTYAVIMASERGDASGVPKMITDMARGDAGSTVAAMLALQTPAQLVGLGGLGLALTVFCSEDANLTTEEATLAKATSVLPAFPDPVLRVQPKQGRLFTECPVWNVGKADAAASAPTVSDLPVLIMEGDFDAATAPEWVNLITPNLENSQLVEFPFTGHAVLPKSTCAQTTMTGFLDNPTKPVDHTCAAQTTLTFTTR
jgi:pimeloyl-ACP methyl ester carboxylesterase